VETQDHRRGRVSDEHREESRRLRVIWDRTKPEREGRGVGTQEAFGHFYGVGNQAAVGFFLNGKTALSLKAATAFARGLKCEVRDFSPRLADLLNGPESAAYMTPKSGGSPLGLSNVVSLELRSDTPLVSWELLMTAAKYRTFRISLPDAALAPDLTQGDELLIESGLQPAPGDLVLVRDSAGRHFARVYRERRPGEWTAHAINQAFEPMAAAECGLEVVGVCIGETRKRRRSVLA
jgi:hypothetical protein